MDLTASIYQLKKNLCLECLDSCTKKCFIIMKINVITKKTELMHQMDK